jgi:hypothetical protein
MMTSSVSQLHRHAGQQEYINHSAVLVYRAPKVVLLRRFNLSVPNQAFTVAY